MAHARTLAEKVKMATHIRRPFLRDPQIPLDLKLEVIRSKILSVGCYGGEWIGLCQRRTSVIQQAVDVALKLAVGSSSKSRLYNSALMSMELGVPTVEHRMADLRIRLYQKAPRMRTWLGILANSKFAIAKRTAWCGLTGAQLKRLLKEHERNHKPDYLRIVETVKGVLADDGKWDDRLETLTPNPPVGDVQRQQRQTARLAIQCRSIYSTLYKPSRPSQSMGDYMAFGLLKTRNYTKYAANLPALNEGVIWLSRLRIGAWWTVARRTAYLERKGMEHPFQKGTCPSCNQKWTAEEGELGHVMLKCPSWTDYRQKLLFPVLKVLYGNVEPETALVGPWKDITWRLLGGTMTEDDECLVHLRYGMGNGTGEGTSELSLLAKGWGGSGDYYLPGLNAHLYTLVAEYLRIVMPQYKACLFPEGKTDEDKGAYGTSAGEESPVKRHYTRSVFSSTDDEGEFVDTPDPLHWTVLFQSHRAEITQADAQMSMAEASQHADAESFDLASDEDGGDGLDKHRMYDALLRD
jgi:hypothetical protein